MSGIGWTIIVVVRVRVRTTPIPAPLFVSGTLTGTVVTPIAPLVACASVSGRIVGASCLSGGYAVFEVSGPWTRCDRRPAMVHGRPLLTVDTRCPQVFRLSGHR